MFQRKLLINKRARRDLNPRPLDSKNCGPSGREAATRLFIWEEVRNGRKNHRMGMGRMCLRYTDTPSKWPNSIDFRGQAEFSGPPPSQRWLKAVHPSWMRPGPN